MVSLHDTFTLIIPGHGCYVYLDGIGGWSTEGCFVGDNSTDSVITCFCDHLTSFTILLVRYS